MSLKPTSNLQFSSKVPSFVVFRVKDTGIGIEKANLENLFQPFFQTKRDDRGTGLGLSK